VQKTALLILAATATGPDAGTVTIKASPELPR
jgi:hypothetical protein